MEGSYVEKYIILRSLGQVFLCYTYELTSLTSVPLMKSKALKSEQYGYMYKCANSASLSVEDCHQIPSSPVGGEACI